MKVEFGGFLVLLVLTSFIMAGFVPAFAASGSETMPCLACGVRTDSVSSGVMNTTGNTSLPPPSYMITNASGAHTNPPPSISSPAPTMSVATDKSSYSDGEMITISGKTKDYLGGTPLTIIIRNPIGNVVKVDQIPVGTDNTFSASVTATGGLWQQAGTYTIYAQYGSSDRSAKTTFDFAGSAVTGKPGNTIPVEGTKYSVTYTITNGKVLGIKADPNSKSLNISIQTSGDGKLTVTMPRALIDAKKPDGSDDQFYVLNDGVESQYEETNKTVSDRTLGIPFANGTQNIEIIGTFVIPEFGQIAVMVLAVAIISIIAISTKTGMRIIPKY